MVRPGVSKSKRLVNVERKCGGTMLPRIRDDDEAALVRNTAEGIGI
jgi:hypothetical protein